MRIDLDEAWRIAHPKSLEIVVDGNVYAVRPLLLADVRALAGFGEATDAANAAWLAGLFNDPPAFVRQLADPPADEDERLELSLKATALIDAVAAYFVEEAAPGKRLAACQAALRKQMGLAAATSTEPSAGSPTG